MKTNRTGTEGRKAEKRFTLAWLVKTSQLMVHSTTT